MEKEKNWKMFLMKQLIVQVKQCTLKIIGAYVRNSIRKPYELANARCGFDLLTEETIKYL